MFRTLRTVAAAAVTACPLFIAVIDAPSSGASSSDQASFVAQINSARAGRGLAALTVSGSLTSVAQNWAARMATVGTIVHNPNLASQLPSGWRAIEENVGMGPTDAAVEATFAASPDHFGNMVNRNVTEVGIGVVFSGGELWVVEDFWGGSAAPPPGSGVPPIRTPGSGYPSPSPAASTAWSSSGGRSHWGSVARSTTRGTAHPPTSALAAPGVLAALAAVAPATGGPPVDLNAVANQVQYFDTWD